MRAFLFLLLLPLAFSLSITSIQWGNANLSKGNATLYVNVSVETPKYVSIIAPSFLSAEVNETFLSEGNHSLKVEISLTPQALSVNESEALLYLLIRNASHALYVPIIVKMPKNSEEGAEFVLSENVSEGGGFVIYSYGEKKQDVAGPAVAFFLLLFLFSVLFYLTLSRLLDYRRVSRGHQRP